VSFRKPQFRPFVRVITALAGILLMLAGEAPLVAWAAESAAMECCPDGHACCRRAHRTQQSGPGWRGEICGMPGCGGSLGTVSIPMHAAAAVAAQMHLAISPEALLLLGALSFVLLKLASERFQRPPPCFV